MAIQTMHRRFAERAIEPRYTFPEASGLVGRHSATIRRWSVGNPRMYRGKRKVDEPLIHIDGSAERGETPLSFLNLLELRFLASYREEVSLHAIRRALDYAARALSVERPLLELDFAVQGRELFMKYAHEDAYFVNASREGQTTVWPVGATTFLASLEYDETERAAYQWWPLGKARPVVLDTRLNAGRPSTAETGVRTIAIAARARRGWDHEEIVHDLAAEPDEIDAALELEQVAA
jgi:uncharacterized protein (DUF433 family)